MNLNLPVEVNDFVRSLVAQGRYSSEEAAVVDGLRLLMGRERLREKIAEGVERQKVASDKRWQSVKRWQEPKTGVQGTATVSEPRVRHISAAFPTRQRGDVKGFSQSAVRALRFRPNGAKCDSLGQRPRKDHTAQTPKPQRGETNGIAPRCFAPLGLF